MQQFRNRVGMAAVISRTPASLDGLVKNGVIPPIDAEVVSEYDDSTRDQLWEVGNVDAWFTTIKPEQAVLVPAGARAVYELNDHRVYVCPATKPYFVGLARPRLAGLKASGSGIVRVFEVKACVTDANTLDSAGATPGTDRLLAQLAGERVKAGLDEENVSLTMFVLGDEVGSFAHRAVLRQGRVVRAAAVEAAVQAGEVDDLTRDS